MCVQWICHQVCGREGTTYRNWFSPSAVWAPGREHQIPDLGLWTVLKPKSRSFVRAASLLGVVLHTFDLSTWETVAGGSL